MSASGKDPRVRVCFVCLGNICRSPTAEGVMKCLVHEAGLDGLIHVESAGTGDWHVGETRDERTRAAAARRGVELTGRAQQFRATHLAKFDYVLAMDRSNLRTLTALAPNDEARAKVQLLRSFDPAAGNESDVPDPYYGGPRGFDDVFDICDSACRALLAHLRETYGL